MIAEAPLVLRTSPSAIICARRRIRVVEAIKGPQETPEIEETSEPQTRDFLFLPWDGLPILGVCHDSFAAPAALL